MSETPTTTQPRHSLFERMRGPMTLLMIAVGGFALLLLAVFRAEDVVLPRPERAARVHRGRSGAPVDPERDERFRVLPFFAAIAVVMLFFFTTQRQTFDATIALVGGLTAGLPTFLKTLSGLGQRSGAKAG